VLALPPVRSFTDRSSQRHGCPIYDTEFDTETEEYSPIDASDPIRRFHPKSLPPTSSMPSLPELFDPTRVSTPPAQRTLAKVVHYAQWYKCLNKAIKRDSNPSPEKTIRNREATRLISTAMPSSGAWLKVVPDNTTRNEFKSMHFEVALQRRLGYRIAQAGPAIAALRAAGRGEIDYHGDYLANGGEHNRRHNAVNFALYEAITAVAIGAVVLGDKRAPEDTAHLNSTHVVDIAEIGGDDDTGNDCLHETKCISSLKKSHALGLGSVANGGAPAPMGHRNAFGNTAEHMRCLVYGCAERGHQHQAFRHDKGVGWVAYHKGQYVDALSRRTKVCLALVESLGGIYYATKHQLYILSKRAKGISAVPIRTCSIIHSASQRQLCWEMQREAICKISALKQQACYLSRSVSTAQAV
jgi:hypothetical protein